MLKSFVAAFMLLVSSFSYAQTDMCRQRIEQKTCLVGIEREDPTVPAPCLENNPKQLVYVAQLLAVYDVLPLSFKRMFCTMPQIYIEMVPGTGGYSTALQDKSGHFTSTIFGVGAAILDRQDNFSRAFLIQDIIPFGNENIGTFGGPSAVGFNQDLYTLVLHEFSHLFDYLNSVNPVSTGCVLDSVPSNLSDKCLAYPNTWTSLSWKTQRTSIFDTEFRNRKMFENYFYREMKTQPISPAMADQMFAGMAKTSFVSSLGSTQPYDDWAESVTMYIVAKQFSGPMQLQLSSGAGYDIRAKMNSAIFAAKKQYIETFFRRTDLFYPDPFHDGKNLNRH